MSSGLFPQDRNILLGLADWAAGLSAESARPYFTFPAPAIFKIQIETTVWKFSQYRYYYWIVVNYDGADV